MNYEDTVFFLILSHFLIKCFNKRKVEFPRYILETTLFYVDLKLSLNFFIYLIYIYRFLNLMDYLADIYKKKELIYDLFSLFNFFFKKIGKINQIP